MVLMCFTHAQADNSENYEIIRNFKCSADLDRAHSKMASLALSEGFKYQMATMIFLLDRKILLDNAGKNVFEGISQSFHIVGNLKDKRVMAYSTTSEGITFFTTTQSMGRGFLEVSSVGENGRKRWQLVYILTCS